MQMREEPEIASIDLNLDWSQMLKVVVTFGLSKVPYAGELIAGIVGVLWPKPAEPDRWAQIKEQVEALVNHKLERYVWENMVAWLKGFYRSTAKFLVLAK